MFDPSFHKLITTRLKFRPFIAGPYSLRRAALRLGADVRVRRASGLQGGPVQLDSIKTRAESAHGVSA